MKQALRLSTKQQLSMTPRLQQAIALLQLSASELAEELQLALESNPMLEKLEPEHEATLDAAWAPPTNIYTSTGSYSEDYAEYQNKASEITLQDHLHWQLNLTPFSDRDRVIALMLIDEINDDGYLGNSIEEICSNLQINYANEFENLDLDEVTAVLHRIQQFDPLGVGCRNLQECMLIQLNSLPENTAYLQLSKYIVQTHLDLLGKKDYRQLKRILQIQDQQLLEVLELLTKLNPRPGELVTTNVAEYIIPDLFVSKTSQGWAVRLNNELDFKLRINPSYAAIAMNGDTSRDCKFLKEQLAEAQWLLNGLQQRNETLLKVADFIVNYQGEFLAHGNEKMRSMILLDVALAVGLNESTISRVTTNKYIHTPQGVYELKYFFSSHVVGEDGELCSSTAVKAIITQLVSREDPTSPLSDQQLTQVMEQRGIKIARRTVAKYREALGILASSQRKH